MGSSQKPTLLGRCGGLPTKHRSKEVKNMKTVNELKEMTNDELSTEAAAAYEYWRKVRAFEEVAEIMAEVN